MSESTKQSLSHYERICARESPYPMNYLPYANPGMVVLVGMMIEKEMLRF